MDLYCFELSIWRFKNEKDHALLLRRYVYKPAGKNGRSREAKNPDVEIKAFGVAEFDENMPNYHVVLLGPQIKYMQNNLSSKASVYGIKVQPIEMLDYGMLRGDRVLDIALELAK